ncbi:MAG: hypothetical protein VYA80_00065 [Pseudomonadota bacterium]|nr:hypothetical protein [Pseudomonadota bacterium]
MRSNLFKLFVLTASCFLFLEQSYRFYSVGWTAFSIEKMNSLTNIFNSGLIELSDNAEIYYQLKPNLDTYFKAAKLTTNSHGLADKEYPIEKPDGSFRIAIIGSSWSMATGVETDSSYHALLEDRFNRDINAPLVEIINFSVEFYSLREIVSVVKNKVTDWKPDLIIIPVTFTTAAIIFEGVVADRELPETIYPFFSSFTLRELNRIGIPWPLPVDPSRPAIKAGGMGIFRNQLVRSLLEIDSVARSVEARTMMVWLGFDPMQRKVSSSLNALADESEIIIVRGNKGLLGTKREEEKLRISKFDRHPNKEAHSRIADEVELAIRENKLLPVQVEL